MVRPIVGLLVLTGFLTLSGPAQCATLVFRSEFVSPGGAITLGNIADISDCDELTRASLARLELCPSPPLGEVRYITQREVREILTLRGIDVAVHEWKGPNQVRLVTSPRTAQPSINLQTINQDITSRYRGRAEARLKTAIRQYLETRNPDLPGYDYSFTLTEEDIRWLAAADVTITVVGDRAVEVDRRIFEIKVKAPDGERTTAVEVRLYARPRVVVAARPLARDTVIAAGDVQLADAPDGRDEYLTRIEDALGRQLTTGIPPGKPIPRSVLRDPVLIRRGEVVQICVRAPGVLIRTLGRAKDDGMLGRLVPVETFDVRGKVILAKVVDRQVVEVYAASGDVANTTH